MPTFATPEPITVAVEASVGDVRIVASDRADTVVVVRPTDPSKSADVRAAERTRVELSVGQLLVKAPKHGTRHSAVGAGGSIDVTIELPSGSHVESTSAVGRFRGEGKLGDCRLKTAIGDIRLDHAAAAHVHTSIGDVVVDRATGDVEVTVSSGSVRLGEVGGMAAISSSNGATRVDDVNGDLRVKAANGDIAIGRAHRSVTAKTANGAVRIADVRRGSIVVETAAGELDVGVHEGTAAWLDLRSSFGSVRKSLDTTDGPGRSDATVDVTARTSFGDIVIHRAVIVDA